jgi:methionyl-tRNA formyltransferase
VRVAFFGTPAFAVPTLRAILASSHEVVVAVTQPDRPRGRGQRVTIGPVKAMALEHGVRVEQPEKLARDAWESTLAGYHADIGVVAAYGKILPEWLLALPPRGLINVHASLLPKYRGASPIHRAVMNGDSATGVTIMRVVKALDAGPMLATVTVPIGPDDRTDQIEATLAEEGAHLLVETLDRLALGSITEVEQDEGLVSHAPRLTKDEGLVDWSRSARAIHDQVRALHPWPHAFTFGPRGRLILHRSRVAAAHPGGAPPGTILLARTPDALSVATGDGVVELLDLQAEGGKVLAARDFLAGHPLTAGDRLGTP